MSGKTTGSIISGPVGEILAEIRQYETRKASLDQVFERWSFAVTALLLSVKIALTVTHAVSPFEHGLPAILFLGAAIVGTAALGQLPTLVRLVRQAIVPGRAEPTRETRMAEKLELLDAIRKFPVEEIETAKFLIVSQGSDTGRRLDFLVGPVSRLGIVPAIVMLLTSFGRLGSTVTTGGPMTLDAFHYATVLTFILYFAAAIADSMNRRVAFYDEVLSQAMGTEEDSG